ncbi:MAG TPA: hypothetical protein VNQ90_00025 [Chthoniobacteraceae bacterium]|nr:hypothetical protein [Chthoniobacteraceae bacterium]
MPCFSARRRIPRHAFGLKKYFDATCVSKTSDKEDATAALWNSAVLRIEHPPSHVPPIFRERGSNEPGVAPSFLRDFNLETRECTDDSREISASVTGQGSMDVFPDDDARSKALANAYHLPEKPASLSIQSRAIPSHGQILAGASSDNNVNCIFDGVRFEFGDVAVDARSGAVVGDDTSGGGVDLAIPCGLHPGFLGSEVGAHGSGEKRSFGQMDHASPFPSTME